MDTRATRDDKRWMRQESGSLEFSKFRGVVQVSVESPILLHS